MEKKNYLRPVMQVEQFIPNDYVAACYHVDCKTDAQNGWYRYVYLDSNNNHKLDSGDTLVYTAGYGGNFRGCGVEHKGVISDTDLELNGFVSTITARAYEVGAEGYITPVYVWNQATQQYGNIHVCFNPQDAERQDASRPNAS